VDENVERHQYGTNTNTNNQGFGTPTATIHPALALSTPTPIGLNQTTIGPKFGVSHAPANIAAGLRQRHASTGLYFRSAGAGMPRMFGHNNGGNSVKQLLGL
jgi:hypothetical protein